MKTLLFALIALSGTAVAVPAAAQDPWPSKPIKLIVPYAPGGNTDAVARVLANYMQPVLKVPGVIESRPGGGGIVGTDASAKSPPDGYTFCICSIGAITISPATEKLPYDPINDIVPVSLLNTNPLILLVNPNLNINSVKELIEYARGNPGKLNYSSSGIAGLTHFSAELFKARTGVQMTHIPYRGGSPATAAVIAGDVQLVFTNMSDAVALLDGGKVKVLAVTTSTRSPSAPNVPTMQEAGVPNYHTESWNALMAPKGTPQPIIERMAQLAADMAKEPAVQKQMMNFGSVAVANTPAEFAKQIRDETALWAGLVKEMAKN